MGGGWRIYLTALLAQRRGLAMLAACSLAEAAPAFLAPRILGRAIDEGFMAGRWAVGTAWLAAFGAAALVGAAGAGGCFAALAHVIEPVRDALVTAMVAGVLHRGAADPERAGSPAAAVAGITRHVETVRDVTAGLLVQGRSFVVVTLAALAGMASLAPELALLVATPLLVTLLLFGFLLRSLVRRQRHVVLADEDIAATAERMCRGLRDLVACRATKAARGELAVVIEAQAEAGRTLAAVGALRLCLVALGGAAPLVLVLAAAPGQVAAGTLTAGQVAAAVVYLTTAVQPALRTVVATLGLSVLRLVVTLRRISEVSDTTSLGTPPGTPAGDAVLRGLDLAARDVEFRYGSHAEPVLRAFDLTIRYGEHLAVVGPSGAGKSTLAGLLTGVTAPRRGTVALGGVPVARVRAGTLPLLALIPQQAYVFTGTLRENLTYLQPEATDGQLRVAADALGATSLLRGLDAPVGSLSAAQRQLVALIRVYVSAAEVVVLDEATSHLDAAAETRVEMAFRDRGGTLIVVAHRLTSAVRADRVLLLDGARSALGHHEELAVSAPGYAQLWEAFNGGRHDAGKGTAPAANEPMVPVPASAGSAQRGEVAAGDPSRAW